MSLDQGKMMIAYDRKRTSTLTLDEQPGAHTGATRQYIPGYSDSNIVYLDTAAGNDSNDGSTELLAKLTYASAATAAGSTKKIRVINNGAALSTNITKPTEMKRGVSGTISSSVATMIGAWSQTASSTFSGSVSYSPKFQKIFSANKYSSDGTTWTAYSSSPTAGAKTYWSNSLGLGLAIAGSGEAWYSSDLETWSQSDNLGNYSWAYIVEFNDSVYVYGSNGAVAKSTDGISWELRKVSQPFQLGIWDVTTYSGRVVIASDIYNGTSWIAGVYTSTDGENFTELSAGFTAGYYCRAVAEVDGELWIGFGESGADNSFIRKTSDYQNFTTESFLTTDGDTYVSNIANINELSLTIVFLHDANFFRYSINGGAFASSTPSNLAAGRALYMPIAGKLLIDRGGRSSLSAAGSTISASVAGFSIQAMQYSGTPTLYNCTLRNPGTTAAISLNGCRVNYGAEIDADSGTHRATLFKGDTYFTTTPASQNAFSLNSNTFGGKCYILNSSQTGYEQIRDNLFADGIDATWPVTVSGRDNVQGVSSNALFGFEVTFNDPKFVDETDYTLQYQTNGYDRNSLAAGRSNIYYNSAGGRRDIGAWSYVESAVSYYHAKTAYISKPTKISVTYEETVSEQQGDNGPVSVYTKPSRVKEILTLVYDVTDSADRAIFDYIRTLTDKGVKVQLFPEWGMNGSTVTVNGNQSAGVEFLTIDAAQVFNGLFLTIAGERYYVLRASPNNTAATKLILDRPLESNVSDNDVITTNYPPGAGEYQFSPPPQLTLEYVDPDTLLTFMRGQTLRFVREWSP